MGVDEVTIRKAAADFLKGLFSHALAPAHIQQLEVPRFVDKSSQRRVRDFPEAPEIALLHSVNESCDIFKPLIGNCPAVAKLQSAHPSEVGRGCPQVRVEELLSPHHHHHKQKKAPQASDARWIGRGECGKVKGRERVRMV